DLVETEQTPDVDVRVRLAVRSQPDVADIADADDVARDDLVEECALTSRGVDRKNFRRQPAVPHKERAAVAPPAHWDVGGIPARNRLRIAAIDRKPLELPLLRCRHPFSVW